VRRAHRQQHGREGQHAGVAPPRASRDRLASRSSHRAEGSRLGRAAQRKQERQSDGTKWYGGAIRSGLLRDSQDAQHTAHSLVYRAVDYVYFDPKRMSTHEDFRRNGLPEPRILDSGLRRWQRIDER